MILPDGGKIFGIRDDSSTQIPRSVTRYIRIFYLTKHRQFLFNKNIGRFFLHTVNRNLRYFYERKIFLNFLLHLPLKDYLPVRIPECPRTRERSQLNTAGVSVCVLIRLMDTFLHARGYSSRSNGRARTWRMGERCGVKNSGK